MAQHLHADQATFPPPQLRLLTTRRRSVILLSGRSLTRPLITPQAGQRPSRLTDSMMILTCPGPGRSTLSTSNSSSILNSTEVAFGILAASLLDVVRDQQHAEAASPYPSGTPLEFEEPANCIPKPDKQNEQTDPVAHLVRRLHRRRAGIAAGVGSWPHRWLSPGLAQRADRRVPGCDPTCSRRPVRSLRVRDPRRTAWGADRGRQVAPRRPRQPDGDRGPPTRHPRPARPPRHTAATTGRSR